MDSGTNITSTTYETLATGYKTIPGRLPKLPPSILDALIPGYSTLADTLSTHFRVDISFYVSLLALLFALHAVWRYVVRYLQGFVGDNLSSTVKIDGKDEMYFQIMKWIRRHSIMNDLRRVKAQTRGRRYSWDDEFDLEDTDADDVAVFNFRRHNANQPPKFEPQVTTGWFYHKGMMFRITKHEESVPSDWGTPRIRMQLYIACLWRTPQPVKSLLNEIHQAASGTDTNQTDILRPMPKALQSGEGEWERVSTRPSRPMSTVVLDDASKARILLDMNEFLQPKMANWYSNRGVPYRRGYLFYGPPGTGKTSMSFSLAGIFGLNIYCLSLSEHMLSEEALIMLFSSLPQRCVVLLEDIDCAGVSRQKPARKRKDSRRTRARRKPVASTEESASDESSSPATPDTISSVSVSGLLNAIDGVASSEGRVLIMTTNYREKLDEALVRPGRADLQIHFGLASTQQIRELFIRMYSPDETDATKEPSSIYDLMPHIDFDKMVKDEEEIISDDKERALEKLKTHVSSSTRNAHKRHMSAALSTLADEFAENLPGDVFSPAEVQGYLLSYKKRPRTAVADSQAWAEEMMKTKDLKAKEEAQRKATETTAAEPGGDPEEAKSKLLDNVEEAVTIRSKGEKVTEKSSLMDDVEDEDLQVGSGSTSSSGKTSLSTSGSSSDNEKP